MRFYKPVPRKPKIVTDQTRREHGIVLMSGIPLRIHAPNGGYLFSIFSGQDGTWKYVDKRWGDKRPEGKAKRVTWEKPI